ncbi:hypothetical protein ACFY0G_17560 [Streptomyces sp. NPDC001552]|uniref:hypothetical protein n=1 Tax=Streptomyces sp. NPDC001552 TaxID=3364587 RepID=UPI0036C09ADF
MNGMTDTQATYSDARDLARAAAKAAARAAALYLIEANGGRGSLYRCTPGEGLTYRGAMTAPGLTAFVLNDSIGDRVWVELADLTAAEYERIAAWFGERNECPHDEECDCLLSPWPAAAGIVDEQEWDVEYRNGELRGYARRHVPGITVGLLSEPVELIADLLRMLRSS